MSLALQVDSLPAKPLGKPLANGIEVYKNLIQVMTLGTSLAGQWLRLHASTAGAWVGSQVGELRPHMPHGMATKNSKEWKKIYHTNINHKKADVILLITNKIDLKDDYQKDKVLTIHQEDLKYLCTQ